MCVRVAALLGTITVVGATRRLPRRHPRVLDDAVAAIHARDVDVRPAPVTDLPDRVGRTAREVQQLGFFALKRGPVYVLLRDTASRSRARPPG